MHLNLLAVCAGILQGTSQEVLAGWDDLSLKYKRTKRKRKATVFDNISLSENPQLKNTEHLGTDVVRGLEITAHMARRATQNLNILLSARTRYSAAYLAKKWQKLYNTLFEFLKELEFRGLERVGKNLH